MNKKLVKGLGLVGVVAAGAIVISSLTFANEQSLLNGMAKWKGGEKSGKVYSKLIDQKNDGYRIYGKVTATNNWGGVEYKEDYCKGVGEGKALSVSINKGLPNPLAIAKASYNNVRSEAGSY